MSKTFPEDKLNRKEEVIFLQTYLTKRYMLKKDEPFVLNINAKWGYGKTYFLKYMKYELEKEHKVIYFDAWKNDFTKEPLLAFIATLTEELTKYFNKKDKKAKAFFKVAFKSSLPLIIAILSKQLTGCTLEELEEFYEEEKETSSQVDNKIDESKREIKTTVSSLMSKATEIALKEHNSIRKSIDDFVINMKKLLENISEDKELPLFILIDELDRCRPNYAIELLENIKHLFDIPGIVFIVATDSIQLSHSINAVYGAKFESERYLKRFFDQEYTLKEPDKYEYCKYLFDKEILNRDILFNPLIQESYLDQDLDVILFTKYAEYFDLGLRDLEQCVIMLFAIMLTWDKEEKIHLAYLLFFIMLKEYKNEYFEKCGVYVTSKFIDELPINKVLEFKGFKKHHSNQDSYKNSIKDILLFYTSVSLIEGDMDKRNKVFKEPLTAEFRSIMINSKSSELLTKYSSLVVNAGQLK